MAAPAFGSIGTQLQGTGSTMNVDVPDSVAPGDIIVVTAFIDTSVTVTGLATDFEQAPDSPQTVSAPSGVHSINVMWKRATAADSTGGTYDFTLSGSTYRNAAAARYTGAIASGSPWNVTNGAQSGNVNDTVSPAVSGTTTTDDTLNVWAATNWSGGTWTPPSGFTERRDSGDGVCTVADKVQATAGATGSVTGTCTGSDKRTAWLGALMGGAVESPAYEAPRLPGRIGPDRRVFLPRWIDDNITVGGAVDLAGNVNVASGGASLMGLSLPLAGNVNAASAGSVLLGLSLPLTGHVDAASQETGNAVLAVGMSGVVPAASQHSGNAVLSIAMTGSVPGASMLGGVAILSISMTGTVPAASGLTGLAGLSLPISSHIDAASGMTGQVTNLVPLSAMLPASVLLTGNLSATTGLVGMIPAASGITGNIVVARSLQGTVPAASQPTGNARLSLGMAGVVPLASLVTGAPGVATLLGGTVSLAVLLNGELVAVIPAHVESVGVLTRRFGAEALRGHFSVSGVRITTENGSLVLHWSAGDPRTTYGVGDMSGVE